jgi:DNA-binding response OmpR family regulator
MKVLGDSRLNLAKANVLLIQNSQTELDILGQLFIGFGVKTIRKFLEVADAEQAARTAMFDLIVADCDLPGGAAFDFVSRLRRADENPNRLAPLLLVSGHTPPSTVIRARDCGANFIVAKPVTPKVMLERVMWLAREERQFVDAPGYAGPDRRHKTFGPPPGMAGRREGDLSAEVGKSSGPDMCQNDIDAMFNPKRALA